MAKEQTHDQVRTNRLDGIEEMLTKLCASPVWEASPVGEAMESADSDGGRR
jgi:hypothetical protein